MNGPTHYRVAEGLLEKASDEGQGTPAQASLLAAAQVHATLALVAVTATGHAPDWADAFLGKSDEEAAG